MTKSRVQINRSGVTLQRPTGRDPGEVYVNFADRQLGVINGAQLPIDLVAIRFFSEEANYQPNDYVINGNTIYRAKAGISAGPFDPAAWDVMTAILEAPSDGKIYGRSNAAWAETVTKTQYDSQTTALGDRVSATESKNSEQDGRLTSVEGINTTQGSSITTIQGEQTTQNNRMTTIEGVNTAQDTRMTNIEAVNTSQASAITSLVSADTAFAGQQTTQDNRLNAVEAKNASQDTAINLRLTDAPADGKTYGRKDNNWATVVGGAVVADAPPGGVLLPGQLWWESDTGNLFIYYNDGDTQQWVQVAGILESPYPVARATALPGNILVNSAFNISQENGITTVSTNGQYLADQWILGHSGLGACVGGSNLSGQQYYGMILNSAAQASVAAAAHLVMYQLIEGIMISSLGWGQAQAVPAVLNFKARSDVSGTFSVCVGDYAGTASFVFDFALVGGESLKEFTVPIPAPAIGSWNLSTASATMIVRFAHSVGATYKAATNKAWNAGAKLAGPGNTNNAATANAYLVVTEVQLLPDPDNTGIAPKYVMPNYADELARCFRYYIKDPVLGGGCMAGGWPPVASGNWYGDVQLPVRMRDKPSCACILFGSSYANIIGTPAVGDSSPLSFRWSIQNNAANATWYAVFNYIANARM